ncbi:hypothetical protein AAMO2058_001575300 [Amorphochlora amoebiformis]
MSFGHGRRFQNHQKQDVPGPRYDHYKAFKDCRDSRKPDAGSYLMGSSARFPSVNSKNRHPGIRYRPNPAVGYSTAPRTAFTKDKRFHYEQNEGNDAPGPRYKTSTKLTKVASCSYSIGNGPRNVERKFERRPGPRYQVDRAFHATQTRKVLGGDIGPGKRANLFNGDHGPGPAYRANDKVTTRTRSAPSATFGTSRRFPNFTTTQTPGPRYRPDFEKRSKRMGYNIAMLNKKY